MRILVIGSGGREHALVWRLSQEAEVHVAPGNPGMASCATCHSVASGDHAAILDLCRHLFPDLVVVGPEAPLIAALADDLHKAGFLCLGPCARAAMLEGSKAWSKEIMARSGVPTAVFATFTDAHLAREFARSRFDKGYGVAVKASGAALGKGAIVCPSWEEAEEAIAMMLERRELGEPGDTIVVEDLLLGREFSLLTICSDQGYRSLPVVQDYKRIGTGDTGPNTGGMGSYSPVPWVSDDLVAETEELVVAPVLQELASQGIPFRGVLFSGLMVDADGPKCLEYNVRLGDPETQTMVRRTKGLGALLFAAAKGEALPEVQVESCAAVTVVMASQGYPGSCRTGLPISLPQEFPPEVEVFHAGTNLVDGMLVTSGGRVLGVSATGATIEAARRSAYSACRQISWEGAYFREDIGLVQP